MAEQKDKAVARRKAAWEKYDSPEESKARGVSEEHRQAHKGMEQSTSGALFANDERRQHSIDTSRENRRLDKERAAKSKREAINKRGAIHKREFAKERKHSDTDYYSGAKKGHSHATKPAATVAPKKTTTTKSTTTTKPATATYTASQKKHLASKPTAKKAATVSAPKTSTFGGKFTTQTVKDATDQRRRRRSGLMKQSTPGSGI